MVAETPEIKGAALPLTELLAACREMPLLAPLAAGSPLIGPSGPLNAPLAFVGEAPGAEEVRKLAPFTGPAGRVLDRLLRQAGIDRRMLYVTNAVKFRPPGNRTPYPYEIAESRACLYGEMLLVRPVLIVTLGSVALRALVPDGRLSELEGTRMAWNSPGGDFSCGLLPLFHPAYTFHDGRAEGRILEGLMSITGADHG